MDTETAGSNSNPRAAELTTITKYSHPSRDLPDSREQLLCYSNTGERTWVQGKSKVSFFFLFFFCLIPQGELKASIFQNLKRKETWICQTELKIMDLWCLYKHLTNIWNIYHFPCKHFIWVPSFFGTGYFCSSLVTIVSKFLFSYNFKI